jgi:hypothetical protein
MLLRPQGLLGTVEVGFMKAQRLVRRLAGKSEPDGGVAGKKS